MRSERIDKRRIVVNAVAAVGRRSGRGRSSRSRSEHADVGSDLGQKSHLFSHILLELLNRRGGARPTMIMRLK
eukprot:2594845-Pleurochrysis_carterae.AAC.1